MQDSCSTGQYVCRAGPKQDRTEAGQYRSRTVRMQGGSEAGQDRGRAVSEAGQYGCRVGRTYSSPRLGEYISFLRVFTWSNQLCIEDFIFSKNVH